MVWHRVPPPVSVLRASVAHIHSRSLVTPFQRNGVSDTRWSCPILFSYDWHWLFLWRFRAFARKKDERRGLLLSVPYDRRPSSIRTINEFSDCTRMKQFTRQ